MEVSIEYNWNLSCIRRKFHFFPSYIQVKQRSNKYLPATLEGIRGKFCKGFYEIHSELIVQYDYNPPSFTLNKSQIKDNFKRVMYQNYVYTDKEERNIYTILQKSILLIDDKVAVFKKIINNKGEVILYINEKFENNAVVKAIKKDFTNVLVYKQSEVQTGYDMFGFGRFVEDVKWVIQCE